MSCKTWLLPAFMGGSLLAAGIAGGDPLQQRDLAPRAGMAARTLTGRRTSDPAPGPDADDLEYPRTDDIPHPGPKRGSRQPKSRPAVSGLSSEMKILRANVRRVLSVYGAPRLNSRDHTPWELLHSIIAYGVRSEVRQGGPDGRAINAIGCLCYNFPCRGYRLLDVQEGRLVARKGVGMQGHHGQLLAILAQSYVPLDYSLVVGERKFTVVDLVNTEKLSCETGMELTFKLISLVHYLDCDAKWKNAAGEKWSIPRLIKEEIQAPIVGAPCGGTHRLMGLSYAVHKRRDSGQPLDGEFGRAKVYTDDFHSYTLKLQNPDGSFSTDWFRSAASAPDLGRRLQTTGHTLEWLVYSLPTEQLTDPRVVRAVDYLSGILLADPQRAWEIGTLGHGLHALALYDQRVFKPHDAKSDVVAFSEEADEVLRLPGVVQQQRAAGQSIVSDGAQPAKPAELPLDQESTAHRGWQVPQPRAAFRR
jgi:hypothetical protein